MVHLREHGFTVTERPEDDLAPVKRRLGVPSALESCHTALVEGYVIEGHVPASDIRRLLKEKPKVLGLAIPGMPKSAPGMDLKPFAPYEVLSFDASGKTAVFAKHATG